MLKKITPNPPPVGELIQLTDEYTRLIEESWVDYFKSDTISNFIESKMKDAARCGCSSLVIKEATLINKLNTPQVLCDYRKLKKILKRLYPGIYIDIQSYDSLPDDYLIKMRQLTLREYRKGNMINIPGSRFVIRFTW